MKTLKNTLKLMPILVLLAFVSCKKDNKQPDNMAVPLVKDVASTYTTGRQILKYNYDEQKRLITSNNGNVPIVYNPGGIQVVSQISDKTITTDMVLEDGRIGIIIFADRYNHETWRSTFSYDTKGRLIKIAQSHIDLPAPHIFNKTYTYTWDENDNLTSAKQELSRTADGSIASTSITNYTGFSPENVNSLSSKNFGFDYFGPSGFPDGFTPNNSGSSSNILPPAYAGKILPTTIQSGPYTYNIKYIRNTRGYIERIEKTINGPGVVNVKELIDIAY